ncbi:MAG: hypothetical protein C4567_17330 [Deltaproteobacteria bacterium]|nr:MAG: hypothetical protein C4567_17330 [Deltaproteobacteria bacterium]
MGSQSVSNMSSAPLGAAGLSSLHLLQYTSKNPAQQRQNLARLCSEVEGVFINQLLQQMRKTFVESADPGKKRTDYYQLCEHQMAQAMAAGGGLGLARRLFEDLQHRMPAAAKENQNDTDRNASGEPAPAGDLPVPGTPGMSGTGSPSPGNGPGRDDPEPGRI